MDIEEIGSAIRDSRVRITDHADEEAANDGLSLDEVFSSALRGEVIEDYPQDRPYPSCLIFGRNAPGKPIHSVWAYNPESQWAVLITVYRPDPGRWMGWKARVRK